MLDKLSLNIAGVLLSVGAILSIVWNHYQYSASYTRFDWITIVLLFLIALLALYKEHKNSN